MLLPTSAIGSSGGGSVMVWAGIHNGGRNALVLEGRSTDGHQISR